MTELGGYWERKLSKYDYDKEEIAEEYILFLYSIIENIKKEDYALISSYISSMNIGKFYPEQKYIYNIRYNKTKNKFHIYANGSKINPYSVLNLKLKNKIIDQVTHDKLFKEIETRLSQKKEKLKKKIENLRQQMVVTKQENWKH